MDLIKFIFKHPFALLFLAYVSFVVYVGVKYATLMLSFYP